MNLFKNFFDWFKTKPKLDAQDKRLRFKEREIWYIYFGVNVGFELDGREEFLRPCLIIKKLSNETFYALPLTSKHKEGSWYYPSFMNNKEGRYVFSQLRSVDAKRLRYFVETVSEKEFSKIKSGFIHFFSKLKLPPR